MYSLPWLVPIESLFKNSLDHLIIPEINVPFDITIWMERKLSSIDKKQGLSIVRIVWIIIIIRKANPPLPLLWTEDAEETNLRLFDIFPQEI